MLLTAPSPPGTRRTRLACAAARTRHCGALTDSFGWVSSGAIQLQVEPSTTQKIRLCLGLESGSDERTPRGRSHLAIAAWLEDAPETGFCALDIRKNRAGR